jgi:hypothetical protein
MKAFLSSIAMATVGEKDEIRVQNENSQVKEKV